ncbi:MAG: hypothetical protein A3A98_02310 [Candidatus Staskawiczbacteria bacterium RIFCSPLOWO2_01_FULL_40_39]|nr:MAG: hypothetical protein A2651_00720 [Candidatus Yanofskybacteria bacterium RIFCSPHIGHO2_01_FULL_42_12]OGZ73770.1 MAG: hypothetical protein A3A98_02310 [Candidatus Staskawiczbacteria bacterium RIFCSPLOWO2_01_FULL_40_39]
MSTYNKQKMYFENLLRQDRLSHTYLFTGPDSTGKKIFVESICVLLTGRNFENNPDLKFIKPDAKEGKHRIDIESIRDLKSFMFLKPHSSEYKLAIVEDAETISDAAANAMLKILEEPPKHSVIILISPRPRQLPATILSRCETVVFPPKQEIQTEETSKALAELRKVAKYGMAERIQYAKKLHEKEDYAELVSLWLRSLRFQLADKPKSAPTLRRLLRLSHILSQPQYNHRIALENFFVSL